MRRANYSRLRQELHHARPLQADVPDGGPYAILEPIEVEQVNSFGNTGAECSTGICERGFGARTALRHIDYHGKKVELSYLELDRWSSRIASGLRSAGFREGDVAAIYHRKCPEQVASFIGILKAGLIAMPLFENLGEDALFDRLADSRAKLVLTRNILLPRIEAIKKKLPDIKLVVLTDANLQDCLSLSCLVSDASELFESPRADSETPAVLHYTSGSTGKPKGVLHAHRALSRHTRSMREVFGIDESNIYWCTADPGWITGTSYGITGPLGLGLTQISYAGSFNGEAWMKIIQSEKISHLYTSPTALRMLAKESTTRFKASDASSLKAIFSIGEPLNPSVIEWGRNTLGLEIFDTYFQSETGAIMIANRPGVPVKPGSMGKPLSDVSAAILDEAGNLMPANTTGELAFRAGWESQFLSYLNNSAASTSRFRGDFYITGDLAWRDEDGYYWFVGRNDDVINTGGHLLGPFEIESALLELDQIEEAAAVAVSDPLLYEKVAVFVKLKGASVMSADIELQIKSHLARKVSSYAIPGKIVPVEAIPKTKSGKIKRALLRAQLEGAAAGDTSTLDGEE